MLRVKLPNRPGSLGRVATALGTANADISVVDLVERGDGWVVRDFVLSMPPGSKPDSLVAVCTAIEGVEVLWVSYYRQSWSLEPDVNLLNRMLDDPANAERTLVDAAPSVFHASWALAVDRQGGAITHRTDRAPDLHPHQVELLGDLAHAHSVELAPDWAPGWGAAVIAVAPFRDRHSIVVGRDGGPEFRPSELARLRHLAALSEA